MAEEWLTAVEMRAWRNFVGSWGPLVEALESDLAPHALTMGDYEVLVVLADAEERRMRMCDLAVELRLSPSGLTRRLDGLVRNGLVVRRACPEDRRVMFAHLTPAGMTRLESAAPDHVASVRRNLFGPLSPEQVEQLGDIFVAVRAGLAGEQPRDAHPVPERSARP
jgi:DNA-binding MarR family transcriptional regulator